MTEKGEEREIEKRSDREKVNRHRESNSDFNTYVDVLGRGERKEEEGERQRKRKREGGEEKEKE